MKRLDATHTELTVVIEAYWRESARGNLPGVRLGQYIWNRLGAYGESWPELFYTEDRQHAINLAYDEIENHN